ncbi:hypothetical protein [Sphingomonas sp.]
MTDPDTQMQPDDHEDAPNHGTSSPEPAEGGDATPGRNQGSPEPE